MRPVGKELFIRFTVGVFRERLLSCASFLFGFEGAIWVLIVLVPPVHGLIFTLSTVIVLTYIDMLSVNIIYGVSNTFLLILAEATDLEAG